MRCTKSQSLYGIHTDGNDESTDNDMFIGALQNNNNTKEWKTTIILNNQRKKVQTRFWCPMKCDFQTEIPHGAQNTPAEIHA